MSNFPLKEFSGNLKTQLLKEPWQWLLTGSVIIIGGYFFLTMDVSGSAQRGDFFAGFAGACAFIWLVAGYRQQAEDLQGQKETLDQHMEVLKGQQAVLAEQAQQLQNLAQVSMLSQVKNLVDDAVSRLSENGDSPEEILKELESSTTLELAANGTYYKNVISNYSDWWEKLGRPALNFVKEFRFAVELYLQSIGKQDSTYRKSHWKFLDAYIQLFKKDDDEAKMIPCIARHIHIASQIAPYLCELKNSQLCRATIAYHFAQHRKFEDIKDEVYGFDNLHIYLDHREDYVDELIEHLENSQIELPALSSS